MSIDTYEWKIVVGIVLIISIIVLTLLERRQAKIIAELKKAIEATGPRPSDYKISKWDWIEDSHTPEGRYKRVCDKCNWIFTGRKSRNLCKLCADK
jgi:hypothetical protein